MDVREQKSFEELESDRDQLLQPAAAGPGPLSTLSGSRRNFCWIFVGGLVITFLLASNVALWAQVRSVR